MIAADIAAKDTLLQTENHACMARLETWLVRRDLRVSEHDKNKAIDEVARLEAEIEALRSRSLAQTITIDELQDQVTSTNHTVQEGIKARESLTTTYENRLNDSNTAHEQQLADVNTRVQAAELQVAELHEKLETTSQAHKTASENLKADYEQRLKKLEDQVQITEKQLEALNGDFETTSQAYKIELEGLNKANEQQVTILSEGLERTRQAHKVELKDLEKRHEQQLKKLKDQLQTTEEKAEDLQGLREKHEERLRGWEGKIQASEQTETLLRNEIRAKEEAMEGDWSKISELEKTLADATSTAIELPVVREMLKQSREEGARAKAEMERLRQVGLQLKRVVHLWVTTSTAFIDELLVELAALQTDFDDLDEVWSTMVLVCRGRFQ